MPSLPARPAFERRRRSRRPGPILELQLARRDGCSRTACCGGRCRIRRVCDAPRRGSRRNRFAAAFRCSSCARRSSFSDVRDRYALLGLAGLGRGGCRARRARRCSGAADRRSVLRDATAFTLPDGRIVVVCPAARAPLSTRHSRGMRRPPMLNVALVRDSRGCSQLTAADVGPVRPAGAELGSAGRHQLSEGLLSRPGDRRAHAVPRALEGAPVRLSHGHRDVPPGTRLHSVGLRRRRAARSSIRRPIRRAEARSSQSCSRRPLRPMTSAWTSATVRCCRARCRTTSRRDSAPRSALPVERKRTCASRSSRSTCTRAMRRRRRQPRRVPPPTGGTRALVARQRRSALLAGRDLEQGGTWLGVNGSAASPS